MKNLMICSILALLCCVGLSVESVCAGSKTRNHLQQELAEMRQKGLEAQKVLGPEWESDVETAVSVPGWKYAKGICLTFSNPRMVFGGEPVSFQIIKSTWSKPQQIENSDTDNFIPFGVGEHGYWFCSAGMYRTAFADHWAKTQDILREFFELQKDCSGLFCRLEGGSKIIPVGKPIGINARLYRFAKKQDTDEKMPDDWYKYLVITDQSGTDLPMKTTQETESYDNQRKKVPDVRFDSIWGHDIARFYDLSQPGIYKIRLRSPLANESELVVESQQTTIRIVQIDFLKPRLTLKSTANKIRRASNIPVKLEIALKEGDLDQFDDITISYCASINYEICRPPYIHEFYGSSTDNIIESTKDALSHSISRTYSLEFDFADGKWNNSFSSVGPQYSIWELAKSADRLYLWVRIEAFAKGRKLALMSNVLQIPLLK